MRMLLNNVVHLYEIENNLQFERFEDFRITYNLISLRILLCQYSPSIAE